MTIEAEEETKAEEEMNAETEPVTTTIVKGKKADAKDKDSPKYPVNIATRMVAVHTAVLNTCPKEKGTKTTPQLKK